MPNTSMEFGHFHKQVEIPTHSEKHGNSDLFHGVTDKKRLIIKICVNNKTYANKGANKKLNIYLFKNIQAQDPLATTHLIVF